MTLDDKRLAALRSAKLTALVADLVGGSGDVTPSPSTSSITGCVAAGRAFVLADAVTDLGPALHWFRRQPVEGLTVLADAGIAGHLARRAAPLLTDVDVRQVEGTSSKPAVPLPVPRPPELSLELWEAAAVIADAGITVRDDHGRLIGEINGLEVARVERADGTDPAAEVTLRVGVGEADRQLHQYVHTHLDDVESLARAAETVRRHRRTGAGHHPLARLARPRWLRSLLLEDPSLIDLDTLDVEVPLGPTPGVRDAEPAAAYSAGQRVTVVCSAGVDLDLIPEAVDYRLRVDPESRLLLVLPPRDVKLSTWRLSDLVPDIAVTALDPPW